MKTMLFKIYSIFSMIVTSVLLVAVIIYLCMLINTNSVVNYVEKIFRGEIESSEIENSRLEMYNIMDNGEDIDRVDVKITRKFVWHDFSDGYMYVKYTCYGYKNGEDEEVYGSKDVNAVWYIHKENGTWKIINIDEKP